MNSSSAVLSASWESAVRRRMFSTYPATSTRLGSKTSPLKIHSPARHEIPGCVEMRA